jgi:hypothetical protein
MERARPMRSLLHPADHRVLEELVALSVLGKIEGHRLDPEGMILVVCSEGHVSRDISQHKHNCYQQAGIDDPYVQKLALHGGPLLLAPSIREYGKVHQVNQYLIFEEADLTLLHSIGGIQQTNRKLRNVALCAHVPCVWADIVEMNITYILHFLMDARIHVKKFFPQLRVPCFLHVDYGDDEGMKTYFVKKDQFRVWSKTHPRPV